MKISNRLLFIDVEANKAYDFDSLQKGALGGTEATVLRIAERLAKKVPVAVAQRARAGSLLQNGVQFIPYQHKTLSSCLGQPRAVVSVRNHKVLKRLRRNFPGSALYLWMHCFPGRKAANELENFIMENDGEIIAVSQTLKKALGVHGGTDFKSRLLTIYNPVADHLQKDYRIINQNKLLFLSSPHKGLEQVLFNFQKLRQVFPDYKLYVADPGYMKWNIQGDYTNVQILGHLRHHEVVEHLRDSFCLFYPQSRFAETFGLVFAEANAVGTPVLTHPFPAAQEVVSGSRSQFVDAQSPQQIITRLQQWRRWGRPEVSGKANFRLGQVARQWLQLVDHQGVLEKEAG